jgi:LacI family transcriptional regulator
VPAFEAVSALLAGGAEPRALICLNDRIAMGAYEALQEQRLRVPDDVAVVSFDGSDLAGWLRPSLASVQIPYRELGAVALDALLDGTPGIREILMPLIPGRSTGRPAAAPSRTSSSAPVGDPL